MGFIVTEELVNEIRVELERRGQRLWLGLDIKLRTSDKYMRISVDVDEETTIKEVFQILELIKSVVHPRIPSKKGEWSWIGEVNANGETVDFIDSGEINHSEKLWSSKG